jgi:hypothetical protein
VERAEHRVGELVVAVEVAAEPAAPRGDAAVGVELEGGLAAVERRRHVIGRELEQGRVLQRSVAAAPERLLEPGPDLGRRTPEEVDELEAEIVAWGERPDACFALPVYTAVGWVDA